MTYEMFSFFQCFLLTKKTWNFYLTMIMCYLLVCRLFVPLVILGDMSLRDMLLVINCVSVICDIFYLDVWFSKEPHTRSIVHQERNLQSPRPSQDHQPPMTSCPEISSCHHPLRSSDLIFQLLMLEQLGMPYTMLSLPPKFFSFNLLFSVLLPISQSVVFQNVLIFQTLFATHFIFNSMCNSYRICATVSLRWLLFTLCLSEAWSPLYPQSPPFDLPLVPHMLPAMAQSSSFA